MPYVLLITFLIIVDQISKYEVHKRFFQGETHPIIGEFFHLTYVQNRGIAFGFFQGKLDIISILTIVAILGIGVYFYKNFKKLPVMEKLGYSFILGGALGNIIDRLYRGFVIDMIDFRGIWTFVFNLADVWINIGVIFILLDSFIKERSKKQEEIK